MPDAVIEVIDNRAVITPFGSDLLTPIVAVADGHATAAEASAALAQRWASESEDVAVAGGLYSAKHYAAKAEDEKIAAAASASAASGSATAAAATSAAQSLQLATSLIRARAMGLTEVSATAQFAAYGIDHDFAAGTLRSGLKTSSIMTDLTGVTFTRALAAYVRNANGSLTLTATGVARRSDKGLLIERSGVQSLRYTQDFTNAVWTDADPLSATATANTTVAPDGTTTADTLTSTGAGRARRQSVTVTASTAYEVSVSLKAGTAAQSRFLVTDGTNAVDTLINWSGGVPTLAPSLGTWKVEAESGGFYRISSIMTTAAGKTSATVSVIPDTSAGLGTVIPWGAGVVAGSRVTSYIPRDSASVTRPADRAIYAVDTLTWPVLVYADFIAPGSDGTVVSLASSTDATNYVTLGVTSTVLFLNVRVAGVEQQTEISPWGVTAGARVRVALMLEEDNIRVCVNGGFIYTDSVADMPPGLDRVIPGGNLAGTSFLNEYLNALMVVPGTRVTDDTLNALAGNTPWYGVSWDYGPGEGHGWFETYGFGRAYKQSSGPHNNRFEMYLGDGSTVTGPEFSVRHNKTGSWLGAAIYARNHDDTDGIQINFVDPSRPALRFSNAGPFLLKEGTGIVSLRNPETVGESQRLYIANTYDPAGAKEYLSIGVAATNRFSLSAVAAGGGTQRGLDLDAADYTISTGATLRFAISAAGLLQLAGTTNSFPALKRSGTTLQVRLADDSAYAPLAAGLTSRAYNSGGTDYIGVDFQGTLSYVTWGSTGPNLVRHDLQTLVLRNVATPATSQRLWIANTYDPAAVREYLSIGVESANRFSIRATSVGGTVRPLDIDASTLQFQTGSTNRLMISSTGLLQLAGTTSSFPALKRSGAAVQVRLADDSAFGDLEAAMVKTAPVTVAALPAAATAGAGARRFVSDATSATFGAAVSGGGANTVPVWSNGTGWLVG